MTTIFQLRTNKVRMQANTIKEGLQKLVQAKVRSNTTVSIAEYVDNGEYLTFVPFSGLTATKGTLAALLEEYSY